MTCILKDSGGREFLVSPEDVELVAGYSWQTNEAGYLRGKPKGESGRSKWLRLHRFIVRAPADLLVDHVNHDPRDNQRCNLRVCSRAENNRNRYANARPTTSGLKGVTWHKATCKWRAEITFQGVGQHLGLFLSKEEAHAAYCVAAKALFGEFMHPGDRT